MERAYIERRLRKDSFSGIDLLTVVMHEMGHVLGFEDLNPQVSSGSLRSGTLDAGVRNLPGNGNGNRSEVTSTRIPGDQGNLVELDSDFSNLSSEAAASKTQLQQTPWLENYLLIGTQNSYNPFGANEGIQIVLDQQDSQNTKLRRLYGKRS